jgi:predicted phage gp36 major capsid-like protein
MLSRTKKEIIEDLKVELSSLEAEEEQLRKDIERIEGKKKQILEEIAQHSDEKYEEDMLALVYQQRRKQ